jgi:hypothetical protein
MSPVVTFSIGLLLLVLFFWYFATDYGTRKRLIATALLVLLVVFSVLTIIRRSRRSRSVSISAVALRSCCAGRGRARSR